MLEARCARRIVRSERSTRRTLRCSLNPSSMTSRRRIGSPKYTRVLRPLNITLKNFRKRPTKIQSSVNSRRHQLTSLCGARPQKIATGTRSTSNCGCAAAAAISCTR